MPNPFDLKTVKARRRKVFLIFVDRVLEEIKKNGTKPVQLRLILTPRSQIITGLRLSVESLEDTQERIINIFLKEYPILTNAVSID